MARKANPKAARKAVVRKPKLGHAVAVNRNALAQRRKVLSGVQQNVAVARTIAVRTLRNDYRAVVDAVAAGEVVAIEDHGQPVAFMAPTEPQRRRYVPLDQLVAEAALAEPPDPEFVERFLADLAAADVGTTDDVVDPWAERARSG
jgi:antitoxin (DNA-binding transcriptional repressor) of toxin-antitoxin stability system